MHMEMEIADEEGNLFLFLDMQKMYQVAASRYIQLCC